MSNYNSVMDKLWILILVFMFSSSYCVSAQDKIKRKTRLKVEYLKDFDKKQKIRAIIKVKQKKYRALKGIQLSFYSFDDTSKVLLTKLITNEIGQADIVLNKEQLLKNERGKAIIEVEFEGNDTCKAARKSVSFKDAFINLSFLQKDSVKYVEVNCRRVNDTIKGTTPLSGELIEFFIKGTFSLLKFGENKTDESGVSMIPFPTDMPGDTLGLITIIAKIIDSEEYGTLQVKGEINWAKPIMPVVENRRGLGDTDAPLWMVYSLIVLLSAVWFHYLFVIIQVIRIKLDAKRQKRIDASLEGDK